MIILTNDDGAHSPALTTTLDALSDKKILPVVPSRDVSGCSMCITIDRPISVEKIMINKHEVFACDGKTADCVLLAKTIFKKMYEAYGPIKYTFIIIFGLTMLSLPIKMYLRWIINLKYIVAIPEWFFNI